MPLSRGCPLDIPSSDKDDLVELLWENGQIVMNGQSSRATRIPKIHSSQYDTVRTLNSEVEPSFRQEDEIIPWLNFPFDDDLPHDYCSDLLPEVSGVTADVISLQHSFDQTLSDSCNEGNGLKGSSKTHMLNTCPLQQSHTSYPGIGSRFSTDLGSSSECRNVVYDSVVNIGLLNNDSSSMNFPHFSKPATLSKMKMQSHDGISVASSSAMESIEKASSCSSTIRPMENGQFISSHKDFGIIDHQPGDEKLLSKGTKDSGNCELAVASSSVGSENCIDQFPRNGSKRKIHEMEDPECHSNDMGTEHSIARKANVSCTGSKRTRAAEVHNLSERKRRDRINEKMRALQELIPNCNKADKASMLDEAIEYLKTLQLQVQIMSMGAGMCMSPPMMFHPARFGHFPAIGYRAGMLGSNGGGTLRCPIFPIPPMQGHPRHSPTTSANTSFPRIPCPNLPIYSPQSQGQNSSSSVNVEENISLQSNNDESRSSRNCKSIQVCRKP